MSLSPAGALRRAYIRPSSPKPKGGKNSREDMSLDSSREDLSDISTGVTDRGAPRTHTPRAPSPVPERKFQRDLLQEPPEDREYDIKLEEPNGWEKRRVEGLDGVKRLGGDTHCRKAKQGSRGGK